MSDQESEVRLPRDGDFQTPLDRVNFEAGMMLGVAATRTEQQYHRQRLNRHQYWLHGAGTVVGLGVTMDYQETDDTESDMPVRLVVSPGVGLDCLGREVTSYEPYCVDLQSWLNAQFADSRGRELLRDGLDEDNKLLNLRITMRYRGCETGLQPVMADVVNAGTDPVAASRTRDSLLLEIVPGPLDSRNPDWFWPAQTPQPHTPGFTATEQDYLDSLDSDRERELRQLQGRMVHAFSEQKDPLKAEGDLAELARTLLAFVQIPLREDALPELSPIVNYHQIKINNLVRPFVTTTEQLTWLSGQE